MNKEFETKVLNINTSEIVEKLRALGATETPEYLMRRYVFDIKDENTKFIRLRDQNGVIKLTYKYKVIGNTELGVTQEIETTVTDFDKTAEILKKLEFRKIIYQENKIHVFHLNGIEFSIATWPIIDPYLEIESSSKEKVADGLELLGLTGKDVGDFDVYDLFTEKGIDMNREEGIKF